MRDHFILGRIGIFGKKRCRLHDLAGLAVAALRDLLEDPGLLQGMIALGGQTFDGGDLLAERVADRGLAGANGFAVDVNRAGATQAGTASEFGTCHLQLLADDPEQRRIARRLAGHIPSVDIEIRHVRSLPMYEAAYGGISLFGYRPAPTGSMPVGAQNDAELSWRQSNLESLEGNKIMKASLVRCGKPLSRTCRSRASGGRIFR